MHIYQTNRSMLQMTQAIGARTTKEGRSRTTCMSGARQHRATAPIFTRFDSTVPWGKLWPRRLMSRKHYQSLCEQNRISADQSTVHALARNLSQRSARVRDAIPHKLRDSSN